MATHASLEDRMMKQEKPKGWEGLETPWAMQVDRNNINNDASYRPMTGDALHDQIRALQLPKYPQARIYTDMLGIFLDEMRIVVYIDDKPLFINEFHQEELKYMLEDGSLIDMLTQRTTRYLKRQEDNLRRA